VVDRLGLALVLSWLGLAAALVSDWRGRVVTERFFVGVVLPFVLGVELERFVLGLAILQASAESGGVGLGFGAVGGRCPSSLAAGYSLALTVVVAFGAAALDRYGLGAMLLPSLVLGAPLLLPLVLGALLLLSLVLGALLLLSLVSGALLLLSLLLLPVNLTTVLICIKIAVFVEAQAGHI
jgi:hypothetical protein